MPRERERARERPRERDIERRRRDVVLGRMDGKRGGVRKPHSHRYNRVRNTTRWSQAVIVMTQPLRFTESSGHVRPATSRVQDCRFLIIIFGTIQPLYKFRGSVMRGSPQLIKMSTLSRQIPFEGKKPIKHRLTVESLVARVSFSHTTRRPSFSSSGRTASAITSLLLFMNLFPHLRWTLWTGTPPSFSPHSYFSFSSFTAPSSFIICQQWMGENCLWSRRERRRERKREGLDLSLPSLRLLLQILSSFHSFEYFSPQVLLLSL